MPISILFVCYCLNTNTISSIMILLDFDKMHTNGKVYFVRSYILGIERAIQ